MKKSLLKILLCLFLFGSGCYLTNKADSELIPFVDNFRMLIDGKKTDLYVLKNKNGMQAAITNYGGRLVALIVPDKDARPTSAVVGFDSLSGYINSTEPYFGATIGRYGNRIADGQFVLDGKSYQLSVNNGPNTLHGGKNGFQYKVFDAMQTGDSVLVLTYHSANMEEGFPGDLQVKVTYRLTSNNELKLDYWAITDKPTVVSLTNHAFFNLNGEGTGTINDHLLQLNADHYLPVDSTLIPFGKPAEVKGTPFDFTSLAPIGKGLAQNDQQLKFGKGYDHNFILNNPGLDHIAGQVIGDESGIVMKVYTTELGLQLYGGNFMQSKNKLRRGNDDFRTAFCLETQHFPDSPNRPDFPSTVLRPGEVYHSRSVYAFSIEK
jgi:aldose 1-epimerase